MTMRSFDSDHCVEPRPPRGPRIINSPAAHLVASGPVLISAAIANPAYLGARRPRPGRPGTSARTPASPAPTPACPAPPRRPGDGLGEAVGPVRSGSHLGQGDHRGVPADRLGPVVPGRRPAWRRPCAG